MKMVRSLIVLAFGLGATAPTARNSSGPSPESLDAASGLPIPACAQGCFAQVLPDYNCSLNDISCICPNANLTSDINACLYSNCTIPEQLVAERYSKDTCGAISRNESGATRAVTWTLFALALSFVAGRFIARPKRLKGSGYGTDDWTILSCVIVLIPFNVLVQTMTDLGLGADNFTLPANEITEMLKQFYVFQILYTILVMTTKISILQLYLRIWTVEAVSRWFRRAVWVLIVIHIVTIFAFCLGIIFECTTISYAWNYWDGLHKGHCINRAAQIYALGAINICYDGVVFVLPLHNFLKLNISWRRKAGVCAIFMVGILVTLCSIIRLQYLVKVGLSPNPTWDYNSTVIWSSVECNFSVVCTCMPAMAGLLQRLYATMTGKPLSTNSNESKAPIKPEVIDPENPVSDEEMLRMHGADSLDESMNQMEEADRTASTTFLRRGNNASTQKGIELQHEPPSEATATRMSYRDNTGRLHEVKVIDKPTDDKIDPGEFPHASESQADALRNLREAETVVWRPEPSMQRDWMSDGPGRRL